MSRQRKFIIRLLCRYMNKNRKIYVCLYNCDPINLETILSTFGDKCNVLPNVAQTVGHYLHRNKHSQFSTLLRYYPLKKAQFLDLFTSMVALDSHHFTKMLIDRFLRVFGDVNTLFHHNHTLLYHATLNNNTEITEYLLHYQACPNVITVYLGTPLINAIDHKNEKLIGLLLDFDANVHLFSLHVEKAFKLGHVRLLNRLMYTCSVEKLLQCKRFSSQTNDFLLETIKGRLRVVKTSFSNSLPYDLILYIFEYLEPTRPRWIQPW